MAEAKTVIGKVSLTPKGAYDPDATYERLDLVQHEGRGYVALKTVRGVTPADGEDYMMLVDKGEGAPGKDGVSPTASVERVSGGVALTVTDGNGTTTATLLDGAAGQPGADGSGLPAVTEADEGKFARVSGGVWVAEALTDVSEVGA